MSISETGVVRVSCRLSVEPEHAFDAWTDPAVARGWLFATPAGQNVRCEIDARPGGRFVITDRRNGDDVAHHGTYLEIDRPSRLVFRFSVPAYSSAESTVEVTVAADGAGAEVTIRNHDVPPEWRAQTEQGWRELLSRLDDVLTT